MTRSGLTMGRQQGCSVVCQIQVIGYTCTNTAAAAMDALIIQLFTLNWSW